MDTLEQSVETLSQLDWDALLELSKNDREAAAEQLFQEYWAPLKPGESVEFSLPRLSPEKYPLGGLIRDTLEKKFADWPSLYSLQLIASELLSNALDHGEGDAVGVGLRFDDKAVHFSVHDQSKHSLIGKEENGRWSLEILDEKGKPISTVNQKLNRSFEINAEESADPAIKAEFVLTPTATLAQAQDEELGNFRGRGFCVIAGYMGKGDEFRLKVHNKDESITAEIIKSIESVDQPQFNLEEFGV